jgi:hypothetical protein
MVWESVVSHGCRVLIAALLYGGSGIQGIPGSHEDSECLYSKSCRLGCAAQWEDRVFADMGSHQWLRRGMSPDSPSHDELVSSLTQTPSNLLHRFR